MYAFSNLAAELQSMHACMLRVQMSSQFGGNLNIELKIIAE
jgi:hypothetical protein